MAFNPERLSLVVEPIGGVGLRWFNYQTDESEDDLIATDYLPDAEKYGLRLYDLIFVSPTSGTEEPYILTVDTIDASGNATLVNSSRFGSDILSYPDKAAVGRIRVPASADNIVVSAYDATVNPSVGRANYRAASDADYAATPALLRVTDAAGRKFVINEKRLSPDLAGGDPDGVTDATAAFNAIFDYIRTDIAAHPDAFTRYVVDMAGGTYRVTGSINATGLVAWNTVITNGVIIGACTGKPVLDLVNSRGYTLSKFTIYGEEDNMPSIGILAARGTTGSGACDNNSYEDVSVIGWFSVAADYCYAQETTQRRHCRFWNYNYDGYCGVYQGYDTVAATSDFVTIRTGAQSFINNQFDNCDWRYLPYNTMGTITGITKGATTTVTAPGHPHSNGETVIFWLVGGMTEIIDLSGTVSNVTATTFDVNINSSAFTNYTSGGFSIRKQTKPSVYWSRGKQHRFNACYIVGYGDDPLHVGFPDGTTPEQITFDFLFEGAAQRSCIRFLPGTSQRALDSVEIKNYASNTIGSFFSTDASGASGRVLFLGGSVSVASHSHKAALSLFDDPTKYAVYLDPVWKWPNRAGGNISTLLKFDAYLACEDDVDTIYGKAVRTWTPTVTASTGTLTTASGSGVFRQINRELAYVEVILTITTNGTGSGAIRFTLPTGITGVAGAYASLSGRERVTGGQMCIAQLAENTNVLNVLTDDNTYPAADGSIIYLSGTMRLAMP